MPIDDAHCGNGFIKEVWQLFDEAQKFPLHSAGLHLVCGIGMLMLSIFGGGNLPLTYGAILSLTVTSFAQVLIFSWLYCKNIPPTDSLTDLLDALLTVRPYLVIAFAVCPVITCLFLCAAIIGLIDIVHVPALGEYAGGGPLHYYLPGMFSIGMGVTLGVVEVIPMRILYVSIKKITLLHELCVAVMPGQETAVAERALQSLAGDLSSTFQRRPLMQFLDEMCRRGWPRGSGTQEACEVLTYTQPTLDPPPPPSYWQSVERQRPNEDARRETVSTEPPIYYITGVVNVVHVESGDLPPEYTSRDNLAVTSFSYTDLNAAVEDINRDQENKDRQTYDAINRSFRSHIYIMITVFVDLRSTKYKHSQI
ncbi:uncharacterized protein LOC129597541 [Paramacrobiotus metropolitanus]|uniref:uncharacterized protein LOC129597541 n=1 Tax=Paramacrobiotus metropolitanus TaxID=2943436 RepID=UPI0024465A2C|nr:uncharacterized protein LOC129597541 [Paramacrobiotus metropolitanus]